MYASLMIAAPKITIYVHGTQQFGSKLLSKDIWYCKKGLHHIRSLSDSSMMVKDAKLLHEQAPDIFDIEHYYTFGWSGKLSFMQREEAGKALYQEICCLLKNYKSIYGQYPAVQVMTFSHGGNVALNMINELPFLKGEHIDLDLILIACPVQKITEDAINHEHINCSYIIYSTRDLLQVADIYSYQGLKMPKRTFASKHNQCYQILVSVNKKTLSHTELLHSFMRHIPEVLQKACQHLPPCHIQHNISDSKFIHFNGFNLFKVLKSLRKK